MSQTKAQLISDLVQALAFTATASAPTNGMFLSATNELAISTNSSTRLTVDSSGNVGIGTTSPGAKLHVNSGTANTCATFESTDAGAAINLTDSNARSTIEQNGTTLSIIADTDDSDASSDIRLKVDNSTKLIVNSSGNLGIGTTSPGFVADIEGSGTPLNLNSTNDEVKKIRFENSGTAVGFIGSSSTSPLRILDGSANERMRIDSSGRLLVGVSSTSAAATAIFGESSAANGPSIVYFSSGDTTPADGAGLGLIRFSAANHSTTAQIVARRDGGTWTAGSSQPSRIEFSTTADGASSATERMRIDSSGNVGIGDSSPANTLSVLGASTAGTSSTGNVAEFAGPSNTNGFQVFVNDTNNNSGIQTKNSDALIINPHGGNVGIGSTNPVADLAVSNGGASGIELQPEIATNTNRITNYNRSSNSYNNFRLDAAQHEFLISGSEKMHIDSSGRLLVQSSSAPTQGLYSQYAPLTVQGYIGSATGNGIVNIARGTTASNLSSDSDIGTVVFSDSAGGEFGRISCFADAAPGSSDYPGRISFHTTSDGASSPTERMRIDSLGRITLGSQADPSVVTEPPVTNYYTSATPTTNDNSSTGTWATNASTAPDGTKTASKFTASSTPASSRFTQISSSVNLNSTAYTLSFYAKSESGSSQTHSVDLGDDVAGSYTVTTSWQRFVFTSLVPTAGRFLDFGGVDGNWSLWGVQIQTESAATSYVKPSGGVATTSTARATVGTRFNDYSDLFVAGNAEVDGDAYFTGNVGIGTTSPSYLLDVKQTSTGTVAAFTGSSDGGRPLKFNSADNGIFLGAQWTRDIASSGGTHAWSVDGSEKARLDSSGRLLIGTTSDRAVGGVTAKFQVEGTGSDASISLIRNTNNSANPYLLFAKSRGTSVGSSTIVNDDDYLGAIYFAGADGTDLANIAAEILCRVDDTPGSNDMPGRLEFKTSSGSGTTTRLTITSAGKFTAPTIYSLTTTGGSPVYVEADGDLLRFTSSLKYKTDVETIEDARADAILNCRPVWYRSKCANDVKTEGAEKSDWGWYGFIAEEVAEIEPRLVNWATKDAVRQEDGSVKSVERDPADYEAEGVRYDNFVPLLVNLIKRQQAAIETLEAKVAALEAG